MLKRLACFPGQGQSYPLDFLKRLQHHDLTSFRALTNSIGSEFTDNLFNNNINYFSKTSNLQPAIVSSSLLLYGLYPKTQLDYLIGHSLGELTTLIINNVWNYNDSLILARKRGEFMEKCLNENKSYGMIALIFNFDLNIIKDVISKYENISIANKNTKNQIVLSGELNNLQNCINELKNHVKFKAIKLQTNIPFHNELLIDSSYNFKKFIELNYPVQDKKLDIPIVSNINAQLVHDHKTAVDNFINGFHSTVLFDESVETVLENELEILNFGPNGKVTDSFIKKIAKDNGKDVNSEVIETV